ncbi:MAG TPA: tyrosine-type recombinase/integrase, partial [Terriglobales bacterium]
CYAAGLRISEAVALTPPAVDSKRMVIRVEQGKGKKDRYTMLSEWQACHLLNNQKNLIMRRRWKNLKIQGRQEAICFALSGMWCASLRFTKEVHNAIPTISQRFLAPSP